MPKDTWGMGGETAAERGMVKYGLAFDPWELFF
jgi:hypothetical protein